VVKSVPEIPGKCQGYRETGIDQNEQADGVQVQFSTAQQCLSMNYNADQLALYIDRKGDDQPK